jgi:DNA-binding NtrC family response regulator
LSLEELQRRHILRVLQVVGGSKHRAAEILGIGRATLYQILSRMKKGKEGNETACQMDDHRDESPGRYLSSTKSP